MELIMSLDLYQKVAQVVTELHYPSPVHQWFMQQGVVAGAIIMLQHLPVVQVAVRTLMVSGWCLVGLEASQAQAGEMQLQTLGLVVEAAAFLQPLIILIRAPAALASS
jgi:hypothetical protein